jgi:hypothetical protein
MNVALGARPAAVVRRPGSADAVLVAGAEDAELFEAGPGGVARRVGRWPWASATFPVAWDAAGGAELFVRAQAAMLQLLPDGTGCVRGPAAAYEGVHGLADLDGDGIPEGLGFATCSGCTSNHVVVGGG